ncbi:MAG: hypothetical protein E7389_08290 [Ruminococcaceae bacterium]|jgi:hypothetical protein|nr:hypothetical protein [Oscillospiraceae bacterium]
MNYVDLNQLKKYIPDIPDIDIREYISDMEKKELIKYSVIAGAAGALTITAAVMIAKKIKKKRKKVQVVEINAEELDK